MLKEITPAVIPAAIGTGLSIAAAAFLSHLSAVSILNATDRNNLQRTFDEVTTEYYVASKLAWLDVVERGYPKRDEAGGEQKSASQLEFESKSHARYQLLDVLLQKRCSGDVEMQPRIAELRCANYRVYLLYDAVEERASTVKSEAEKDGPRLGTMSRSCPGVTSLLELKTSRTENIDQLKTQFAKEHRALLEAMASVREGLTDFCD